jgi:hypothetical protein
MFHLVEDTLNRVENNLIESRIIRDSWFSMWFNIVLLVMVVGGFGYFLYSSYGTQPQPEMQEIPYKPVPWMNAVRNVRSTEYGQLPQTEIGGDVSGYADRSSAYAF